MEIAQLLFVLFFSLTVHELMHALVSDWLGDSTARQQGRITLNPMAHIDPFTTLLLPALLILAGSPVIFAAAKPVPFTSWAVRYGKWGVALVAVAGPLTNLAVALILSIWLRFVNSDFLLMAVSMNVAFFVFNMIPFPPLDGSRLLYALAPRGLREVMDRIEQAGFVAILAFMFLGFPLISRYMSQVVGAIMGILV